MSNLWPLIGIAVVVAGFVARFNPLLVVAAAALATGIAHGLSTGLAPLPAAVQTLETFGKAFNDNRYITLTWMILPVIGLLERAGLQEKARDLVAGIKGATTGRLLLLYLAARQITSAGGLTSLGGHPQMVRPLIAPMAEGAAEARLLLIKGFLEQNGIIVEPLALSVWAIPTAILAFIIHGIRLWRLDGQIAKLNEEEPAQ
ncbi:MAG: hypothetical protein K0R83_2938 [Caulobacter sp.]|nr:hypothetical protein [Caulobacter sp.]